MDVFCKRWIKLLFLAPTLAFFLVWTAFPLLSMIHTSLVTRQSWPWPTSLANYAWLLHDERLAVTVKNSLIVVGGELLLLVPLSFLLGLLLDRGFRGSGALKLVTFYPYIISGILTSLVWFFVVDPRIGILNALLERAGLGFLALKWIGGMTLTPYTVAVLDSWKAIGFYAVLALAGLKLIPREMHEAAAVDGASPARRAWSITVPLMKETLKVSTILVFMDGLKTFQTVFLLTRGGPRFSSHVLATYIYWLEWQSNRMTEGNALAVLLFLLSMGVSIMFLMSTRRRVEE
jgi:raffinose/stachyose/melibiose transport system permease protein